MCGIIGCISDKNVTPFLLAGLEKESYRGYDSSGIALVGEGPFVCKTVGKLDVLKRKVAELSPTGLLGIGHNRWATHGGITEANAHPHTDCHKEFFVVHNGIIENYAELRQKLEEKGHTFTSETDTEVLAHLIEQFYADSLEDAVRQALQVVKGTYGLIAISTKEPDQLVAARMSSPLAIAVSGRNGYVASDSAALSKYAERFLFLDDGEIATVKAGEFKVTDLMSRTKYKPLSEFEWESEDAELGAFPHFMLKEIYEQPKSLKNSLRGRVLAKSGQVRLGGLAPVEDRLKKIERLNIIACGTAYYAGLIGQYMLEEHAKVSTEVGIASEFRYRDPIITPNTASLFISQSGETADTLAVLQQMKERGELTLGLVNTVGSSIARETDAGIHNHAGPEIGVASTKAFTSQIALLALLTVYFGRQRGMSKKSAVDILHELTRIPDVIAAWLESQADHVAAISKQLASAKNVMFVGRKYNYPVALEGALKLKEVTYLHAEGFPAGELKHGAIALIDENTPTIAICPTDSVYDKTLSNMQEIKSRVGPLIAIASEGDKTIHTVADEVIFIPTTLEMLTPLLSVIPLQLLAYYVGVALERDIDRPRNLAKSVTVE